jgi:hypothetical protein
VDRRVQVPSPVHRLAHLGVNPQVPAVRTWPSDDHYSRHYGLCGRGRRLAQVGHDSGDDCVRGGTADRAFVRPAPWHPGTGERDYRSDYMTEVAARLPQGRQRARRLDKDCRQSRLLPSWCRLGRMAHRLLSARIRCRAPCCRLCAVNESIAMPDNLYGDWRLGDLAVRARPRPFEEHQEVDPAWPPAQARCAADPGRLGSLIRAVCCHRWSCSGRGRGPGNMAE